MRTSPFERLAGACAILAAVTGFLYAIAFVIIARSSPDLGKLLSGLFLLLGGLFVTCVFVALYHRLREVDAGLALWALLLGAVGAVGSVVHGAYDLANAAHPPVSAPDLPNPIDPRGVLVFGVTGLSIFLFAWLMRSDGRFPQGIGYLGYVLAALLVLLYLGRLIVLDVMNPVIAIPAVLTGFLLNPLWYVWIGRILVGGSGGPGGREDRA